MLKISIVKKHGDNTSWRTIAGLLVFFKSLTVIGQVRKIQKSKKQKFPCKIVVSKINIQ